MLVALVFLAVLIVGFVAGLTSLKMFEGSIEDSVTIGVVVSVIGCSMEIIGMIVSRGVISNFVIGFIAIFSAILGALILINIILK